MPKPPHIHWRVTSKHTDLESLLGPCPVVDTTKIATGILRSFSTLVSSSDCIRNMAKWFRSRLHGLRFHGIALPSPLPGQLPCGLFRGTCLGAIEDGHRPRHGVTSSHVVDFGASVDFSDFWFHYVSLSLFLAKDTLPRRHHKLPTMIFRCPASGSSPSPLG